MDERQATLRSLRRILGAMSLALFAYAAAIAWKGHVVIIGRPHHSAYSGAEALQWAGLYACFGAALLGVFMNTPARVGTWIGTWLVLGIAIVLVPAYTGA
ncbi:hypothetical protein [Novosphingobium sp.]|uniref:hypothetical protein n=1 Tax=Novosphingobium sp. TaxID=1874826 RepID=UPI0035B34EE4